jgi:hypothetical protein
MYESRKSESESSKLISEVPLIVNPIPNFNSSNNINLNNNTGTNKSLPVDNNNSLGSSGTIMGSGTNPGPLPPKYMPPSPKLPQSPPPSEKVVNIVNSSSTQIINDGNSEHKLKIEEQIRKKYGTSPIR